MFEVDIYEGGNKCPFTARTDMTWVDFKNGVIARLDAQDIRLNYRIWGDARAWLSLVCEVDLTAAVTHIGEKALSARTWAVSMEIKNAVSNGPSMMNDRLTFFWLQLEKASNGPGKGKRTRADDIPPPTPPNMVKDVDHLRDLQDRLLCAAHSKPLTPSLAHYLTTPVSHNQI